MGRRRNNRGRHCHYCKTGIEHPYHLGWVRGPLLAATLGAIFDYLRT